MTIRIVALLASVLTCTAHATPLSLTDITALVTGGASDLGGSSSFFGEAPPDTLPIEGEAIAALAAASARLERDGALVEAEVLGEAAADALAEIDARFASPGSRARPYEFTVNLEYSGLSDPDGSTSVITDFLVGVFADGNALFTRSLLLGDAGLSTRIVRRLILPAGTFGTIALFLGTDLVGGDPGASDGVFALADFRVEALPQPGTMTLLVAGLLALGSLRVTRRRATA